MSRAKKKKLVIFGLEDFADIAYEYFTNDSEYEVASFTVDRAYLIAETKSGLPVIPFDELEAHCPPSTHELYAAVAYARLNRNREEVCRGAKEKGYKLARYVSSRAFVSSNAKIGEHCFVFEGCTIQPFVSIGDNAVLWSASCISHHSRVGSHCFVSPHVAVGGWTTIEDHCFLGINSTLANNTRLGNGSWVSHGCSVSGTISPGSMVRAPDSKIVPLDEARLFRGLDRASRTRATLKSR